MKLTEKELNEFPIGTKITYYSNYVCIKVANTKGEQVWLNLTARTTDSIKKLHDRNATKVEIPTYTEYIPTQPILDDIEKEYLSNVIRPFRNKVKYIKKVGCIGTEYARLHIVFNDDVMSFPAFYIGRVYKGMEPNREYSLEELRFIVD